MPRTELRKEYGKGVIVLSYLINKLTQPRASTGNVSVRFPSFANRQKRRNGWILGSRS